jgi:hypothetical protein
LLSPLSRRGDVVDEETVVGSVDSLGVIDVDVRGEHNTQRERERFIRCVDDDDDDDDDPLLSSLRPLIPVTRSSHRDCLDHR